MTDSEYLSQRKELENRIAQLDAAHLNDREYMDGDHVHIDIGWKSVCGMICGCYLEKADGSMVLRGKLSDRHLWVANLRSYEYRVSLHNHLVRRAYSLRASKNRQVAEYGFELSTGRKNHHAPHAAE